MLAYFFWRLLYKRMSSYMVKPMLIQWATYVGYSLLSMSPVYWARRKICRELSYTGIYFIIFDMCTHILSRMNPLIPYINISYYF